MMGRGRDKKVDVSSNMGLLLINYFVLTTCEHLFLIYMIGI